jgi:hypothetical protein
LMICSGLCRLPFIESPPGLPGRLVSHNIRINFWGALHSHNTWHKNRGRFTSRYALPALRIRLKIRDPLRQRPRPCGPRSGHDYTTVTRPVLTCTRVAGYEVHGDTRHAIKTKMRLAERTCKIQFTERLH